MGIGEIKEKLTASNLTFEEKEINAGQQLKICNGCVVNVYNNGTVQYQGKNKDVVKEILENKSNKIGGKNNKIFVVYGHDDIAKTQLDAILRRWDLEPVILDQVSSTGTTIIEKLEKYTADVNYAIVLATPNDEGKSQKETTYKKRVRQNVVLELGMFLAKLGRERVAILLKEDESIEKPSDIAGLVYIPFKEKVEECILSLVKELASCGFAIDNTKL